jgi:transposase
MKKEAQKKGVKKMITGLPVYNAAAGGVDIGDTFHCTAINDGNLGYEVKTSGSFTSEIKELVLYLQDNGITTVAMESTGVYWLPLYLMLEENGIEPYLVNAKHVKNVTGRKKDDTDAIWLQKLHTCGLLQKSFQPDNETRVLRDYVRQRKSLINLSSDSVRRMQKALELMNIKIHTVISDILGKTGMKMVKAIIGGERDAKVLVTLCDPRIKATQSDIIKSLEGIWKDEYLFMLEQALQTYEFHQGQIKSCEEKIKSQLERQVSIVKEGDVTEIMALMAEESVKKEKKEPKVKVVKVKKVKKNQFDMPIAPYLVSLTGVDLCKIPGISEITALELISEIGTDMNKWKSSKQFAAWLNLCPNTKITGGKIISNTMMRKKNRAGQCLRQAASCLSTNKSPMGDYYRRMRAKLGGKGAALSTAHKLARIIYTMLSKKTEFDLEMIFENQEKFKEAKIKKLEKQLAQLRKAA